MLQAQLVLQAQRVRKDQQVLQARLVLQEQQEQHVGILTEMEH